MPKQYIQGFPTTQAQMAEWQSKYKYDPSAKKWYQEASETTVSPVEKISTIQPTQQEAPETKVVAPIPTTATVPSPEGQPYKILPGETLSQIATRQGTTIAEIMASNPQIRDPNVIYAGQSLTLPGQAPTEAPIKPQRVPEAPITPETVEKTVKKAGELGLKYPAEFVETLAQPPEETEEEIRNKIYEKYGIEDLEIKFREKPELTFEEIYSSAYSDLKLEELKAEIDEFRKKIADAEANRDEAIETINENPWLSEASRIGRVKRLYDKAQRELTRLQNQLTLADTMYGRGKEEAENVATRALNTFIREREWTKEELKFYIDRAESELRVKFEMRGVEAKRERFRYFPDFVSAIPPEEDVKEEVKEETDIETQLLASIGTDGFVDPKIYMSLRTKAKIHPTEFNKRFSHLLSPQERVNLRIEKENETGTEDSIDVILKKYGF